MKTSWPVIDQDRRLAAIALGAMIYAILYWGAAALAWRSPVTLVPSALDAGIPLRPLAIWIYLSEFVMVIFAIWIADPIGRTRAFVAIALATTVACVVFVVFPTAVPRVSSDISGITELAWRLLYAADTPSNALPSLHAAIAVAAAATLWRLGGIWRVAGPAWGIAVLVGALATKQHFVADLLAGLILGALAQGFSVRWLAGAGPE